MLAVALAAVAWTALRGITPPSLDAAGAAIASVLPPLVAGLLAWRAYRSRQLDQRDATGWMFVGLACLLGGAFASFALIPSALDDSGLIAVLAIVIHHAAPLLGGVGVLYFIRRLSPAATLSTSLDLICVVMLGYLMTWQSILSPTLMGDGAQGTGAIDSMTTVATPAIGMLVLVAVVAVLGQVGRQEIRGADILATVGFAAIVATDFAVTLKGVHGHGFMIEWFDTLRGQHGPIDLGWILGMSAIGFSAAHRSNTALVDGKIPIVERSTTWEMAVALVPFAALTMAIVAWRATSDTPSVERSVLVSLVGVLILRCALVGASGVRQARASTLDGLTGMFNHRHFQERLPLIVQSEQAAGRSLALVVLDVDDFAQLNEHYSHAEGDRYLREVAWAIRRELGSGDLAFRNGGDEFALVLVDCDASAARGTCERINQAVAGLRETASFAPTLTMGVAIAPTHTTDPHELVELANGTLYWSKLNGKDAVTCYDPDVVEVLNDEQRLAVMEHTARLRAVLGLARALDARDAYTARHSENVSRYAVAIAAEMGWSKQRLELLRVAGLLHDIGKIGVRDSTLCKASKLTDEEWAEMRQHPVLGARMIDGIAPDEIVDWVTSHHERWDGKGYPHNLAGDAIPDGARILAVADTFDAMTSSRSYRPALSPLRAINEIATGAGDQFDADVARAFLATLRTGAINVAQVGANAKKAQPQDVWESGAEVAAATAAHAQQRVISDPEFAPAIDATQTVDDDDVEAVQAA